MSNGQYMSQTQQQRLQMVLAPQLRQSLALLQVPILELRTLVQQEMQQNPTLEEKIDQKDPVEIEPGAGEADANKTEEQKELDFKEEFEVLARLDDEWREYFQQDQAAHRYTPEDAARRQHFFDSLTQPQSLQEHLSNQLMIAGLSEEDQRVAEMLVGSINDDGYLVTPLEELAQGTGFAADRLQELLQVVQEFDPIGVGAKDLKECLLLQLNRLGKGESMAATIVRDHLDDLGARRHAQIASRLGVPAEAVQEAARFISTLEPRPGRLFSAESPDYVLPEVSVQKTGGDYTIALDRDSVPRLFISKHYRQLMENPDTPADVREYIRDKIRAAYELGGKPLIEVLDAQRAYRDTYRLHIASRSGYWHSLYALDVAVGKQVLK